MQRKLNLKLLAIVAGSLLLAGGAVHLLHGYQLQQNAYRLLERGDAAMQAKDLDKALTLYSQYLSFVPNDADTIQKYAEALDVQASTVGARVEFVLKTEQVLRAKPNEHALRLRLVHSLIALDRVGEAIDQLRKLQDQWPDKAEVLHMLGWCQDAQQKHALAATSFEEAIRINPKQIRSYALLAEVQQDRLALPEEAQKTMDALVRANPESWQAYLLRGRFLRRRGDEKAAAGDLQTAYRLGPDQADVILEVADAARAKGDWAQASRLLEDGMKRFPDNADFVKAIVGVELVTGKPEAAIEHLRDRVSRSPRSSELSVLMIDLLIDQKQYAEARGRIDDLVKAGMKPALPNYLKGRLCVADGDYTEAIRLLESVGQDLGPASEWSGRVHALLGYCYRQTGDHEKELQAFRRAVEAEPTWSAAAIGLGEALLAHGRIEEALQALEPLRTAKDVPAGYWILLSRSRLYRQQRLPATVQRWDGVEDALTQAERAEPGNVNVALMRAQLLVVRGDIPAARSLLEQAKAEHGKTLAVWFALADLDVRQNRFDAAERDLDQAQEKLGDSLELRLARCQLWSLQATPEATAKLARLEQMPADFTLQQRARLYRELAESWRRVGNLERADKLLRELARELPDDTRSRFALIELALQRNQPKQARNWRNELFTLEGETGRLWRYADAAILVREAQGRRPQLEEARQKLEALDKLHKNWAKVAILTGFIFELEGKHLPAIQQYMRAVELGDMPAGDMARLMELLIARREFAKAETELAKFEQRTPLTRDLARLGAEAALGMRDPRYAKLALERAEFAVSMPVTDYRDALWLARVYQAAGENAKAEKMLQDSLTQAGHTPDVWIAWMEHLTRTNQRDQAPQAIEKMKQLLPKARQPLTLARCYEALWQWASAAKAYDAALADAPDDFITLARAADFYRRTDQPHRAAQCYEALLDPALVTPAELVVSARRQLAVLLAERDRTKALAYLEENKKALGDTIADERIRLFLQSLAAASRPDAIRKFEETLRLQPATPDERVLFARMLEASESFAAACDQLAQAVDEAPMTPLYLAPYARSLIRIGDVGEARRQLGRLETIEPNGVRTAAVRTALERAKQP